MLPRETGCVGPFPTQNIPASALVRPSPQNLRSIISNPRGRQSPIPELPHSTVQSPWWFCQTGWLRTQDPPGSRPPPPIQPLPPSSLTAKAESSRWNITF